MAFRGAGSSLQASNSASPPVFTAIAEVIEITGPETQNDEIEVTNLSSTAKEFIGGLKDNGTLEFEAHFATQNAQQQQLFADADANPPVVRTYRVVWADPTASPSPYFEFSAFVQSLSNSTPPNDSVKLTGTLRITGSITRNF